MFCPVCRVQIADDAVFCPECGASIAPANPSQGDTPYYGGPPPAQMNNVPNNQPQYGGQPQNSQQPPYGGGQPPYGGGQPPYGGGQPPYGGGQPPYGGGQQPYGGGQPPYGGGQPPSPPPGKPGGNNMMKILIPVGVVVLAAIVVVVLWLTGVLSPGQNNNYTPSSGGSSTTRDPDRNNEDDENGENDNGDENGDGGRDPSRPPTAPPDNPTPTPTSSPAVDGTVPGGGGNVPVNGGGDFSFTPDRSGMWTIRTILDYDSDPYVWIYDSRDNLIAENDDGAMDDNSFLIVQLDGGSTYTINAGFYDGGGSYTLHVSPAETIPPGGGDIRINGGLTGYLFTPSQSAIWEFSTSNNGGCDPYVVIFDSYGDVVDYDDDSGGDLNAYCATYLEAGTTYSVNAGIFLGETGSYTLTVTSGGTGGGGGQTPVAGSLSGSGGSVQVNGSVDIPFTPSRSGIYIVYTSDNGISDPVLAMYYSDGGLLAEDDDGWGDLNSLMFVYLDGGDTYIIEAGFYGGLAGSCTLTVRPPAEFYAGGGTSQVNGPTGYVFTPAQSGTYEFRTSNNGSYDPYLQVYDPYDLIADDDDSAGNFNAVLTVNLTAGVEYDIFVGFWDSYGQRTGTGSCSLTITRR